MDVPHLRRAKYTFLASDKLPPYVEIGAGPDLADRIPEKGSQFNFDLQAGAGLSYFVLPTTSINVTYRFQHLECRHGSTEQGNRCRRGADRYLEVFLNGNRWRTQ
jgi:opacity protein-like surface antigen